MNINEDKFEITKNLLVGVLALSFILGLKKMKTKLEKKGTNHMHFPDNQKQARKLQATLEGCNPKLCSQG